MGGSSVRVDTAVLEQAQHLTAGIMDTSPTGILVVSREGYITFANAYAEQIMGMPRAEITQLSYWNCPEKWTRRKGCKIHAIARCPYRVGEIYSGICSVSVGVFTAKQLEILQTPPEDMVGISKAQDDSYTSGKYGHVIKH